MSDLYRLVDGEHDHQMDVVDSVEGVVVASIYHEAADAPTSEEWAFAEDLVARMNQPVDDLTMCLRRLLEAARPFLVDDVLCMGGAHMGLAGGAEKETFQCKHCGAHAEEEDKIDHHGTCIGMRLRKAIEEAE